MTPMRESELNGRTKLTREQVAEVRARARAGISYRRIAAEFGIGLSHVGRIVRFERRTFRLREMMAAFYR